MAVNYALDILSCPPDGSNIKSIVYTTPTKLSVIEGANTLISIDLSNFFIPITNAQQTTFILPGHSGTNAPISQYSFTYCGLNADSTAKFAAFFPSFPSNTASENQYIEWTFLNEIEEGTLAVLPPVLIDNSGSTAGATGSDTSYQLNNSKDIAVISGSSLGLTATSVYAICTRGGLKIWSPEDAMLLFNTFNSEILSNDVKCITSSPSGVIWVGTDKGISSLTWSSAGYAFSNLTEDNSSLLSNNVQAIDYVAGILAIATDAGISLYDTSSLAWQSFSKLTVNEINVDSFTSIKIDGVYVIAGSEDGVFVYNTSSGVWSTYNSSVSGWSLGDYVNRVESFDTEVFAGTTGGIVTFSIGATVCETLVNSLTGPYANITGLVYSVGSSGNDVLYVSHGGPTSNGAISAYDIAGGTWSFGVTGVSGPLSNGTTQIGLNDYLYFTNSTGFARFATGSHIVNSLPLSSQNSDILFSFPENGAFPVALFQKLYLGFSKPVDTNVLHSHASFKNTSTGATFSYSLASTSNESLYEMTLGATLAYATQYTLSVVPGLTATDNTYFRQSVSSSFYSFDKNPASGWKYLGKQLLLSGAESRLLSPIVFRNPQTFDVNVLALVAI